MKKNLFILLCISFLLAGGATLFAKTTKKSVSSSAKLIKSKAITGDFDGDGKIDKVWTEGKYDKDGYAVGNIKLCSDNPRLAGKVWSGGMGVELMNLGKLTGGKKDYLGAIPYAMSTWCSFETLGFSDGKWKNIIAPYTVWFGDEDSKLGTVKPKSGKAGYVGIYYNDMDDDDRMFDRQYKEVKIK